MSETEVKQEVAETAESTAPVAAAAAAPKKPVKAYIVAVIAVAVIILGALYLLEKEGRSSTNLFASIIEKQQANAVVAVVNGQEIVQAKLDTSIEQFGQMAMAQGVDVTSPEAIAEMRTQALDVLINTTLLEQDAAERGFSVDEAAVSERRDVIIDQLGSEEALAERMATLGIEEDRLTEDIRSELLIQQLLDAVFADAEVSVSEEEIAAVYEGAGGAEAGLPALEEVRGQVETQIRVSKEQAAIDDYLAELKERSNIEVK